MFAVTLHEGENSLTLSATRGVINLSQEYLPSFRSAVLPGATLLSPNLAGAVFEMARPLATSRYAEDYYAKDLAESRPGTYNPIPFSLPEAPKSGIILSVTPEHEQEFSRAA
jgi:hypothetical protein